MANAQPGFATTRWTIVRAAADRDQPDSNQALAVLCEQYRLPVFRYVRRRVRSVEQAEDLTQEFFARIVEKDFLGQVDPARGRFRSFLLASVNCFLANQHDHDNARKRGGGWNRVPLSGGESGVPEAAVTDDTVEREFERSWARTLLERSVERLSEEYAAGGRGELFAVLRDWLPLDSEVPPYHELATRLNMSQPAARVAIHRLRQRLGHIIRDEVAETVSTHAEVDDEIQRLQQALQS